MARKTRKDFETESAWRTYDLITPKEEEKSDEDIATEVTIYYVCKNPKCDFIKKQTVVITEAELEQIKQELPKGKCPNCGSNGFKLLKDKEEYEKELKRIKKLKEDDKRKKEQEQKQEAVGEAKLILDRTQDDIKKLYEDLRYKLEKKDITPECFVTLFFNISFDIMNHTNKLYRKTYYASLIDLKKERKTILEMGQIILDLYNIEKEEIDIIENYNKEDENYKVIYNAYYSKYELGIEQDFNDYKMETRLKNYIDDIERKRKIEEKNLNKVMDKSEKRANKLQEKEEDSFAKSLSQYVNKVEKM